MSGELSAPKGAESSRYARAYKRSESVYGSLEAITTDVETVARVIAGLVRARSVRARYPIGLDAKFNLLSDPITPTALRDRALRAFFGLCPTPVVRS